MNSLLIATHNPGKLQEIRALLKGLAVKLVTPDEIALQLEVAEDGQTYVDNAAQKAVAFARASGLITLADDSGLEVDALQGAPGLHSARYLPQAGATDADRRAFLLRNLVGQAAPLDGQLSLSGGDCRAEERGADGGRRMSGRNHRGGTWNWRLRL